MLIEIIHIFYYHGRLHDLDVEFMKCLKILYFLLLNIFQKKATNGTS